MAKYNYINNERRYYRGVTIWYDLHNEDHWYIETCTTIHHSCGRTQNPVNTCRICRVYFKTLTEARNYIDEF